MFLSFLMIFDFCCCMTLFSIEFFNLCWRILRFNCLENLLFYCDYFISKFLHWSNTILSFSFFDKNMVSILNSMLCSFFIHKIKHLSPSRTKQINSFDQHDVFLRTPISPIDILIQLIKPLFSTFGSCINFLSVGDTAVFEEVSDSFAKSSDGPVAEFDWLSFHKIRVIY